MNGFTWLSAQVPALPQTWAMRLDVSLGWALVLALLGALLGRRLPLPARRLLALVLAAWTLLPGTWSLDYWLGLAFHAPSLSAQLLCVCCLRRELFPSMASARTSTLTAAQWGTLMAGVLLGYGLLLDTFAVLPWAVYAWGFGPLAPLLLLGLGLLPWVVGMRVGTGPAAWLVPVTLLLFAATRLPTGNVWDAVLDPWLWVLLQAVALRAGFRQLVNRRS